MVERNGLKIFVGNLPFSASPEDLHDLFAAHGDISGINIRKDSKTSAPKGFAFITFSTEAAASEAIAEKNGFLYQGRILTVNSAVPRGGATAGPTPALSKSSDYIKTSSKRSSIEKGTKSWSEWAGPVHRNETGETGR